MAHQAPSRTKRAAEGPKFVSGAENSGTTKSYKFVPETDGGAAALSLPMPPSEVPEQDRGGNTPPPNPDQGHQEGPTIPGTGCYHPTTITGVKQVRKSGRGICRLVTLCGTVTQLVAEYDRRLVASESDTNSDTDENDEEINEDQHPERREEIRR